MLLFERYLSDAFPDKMTWYSQHMNGLKNTRRFNSTVSSKNEERLVIPAFSARSKKWGIFEDAEWSPSVVLDNVTRHS